MQGTQSGHQGVPVRKRASAFRPSWCRISSQNICYKALSEYPNEPFILEARNLLLVRLPRKKRREGFWTNAEERRQTAGELVTHGADVFFVF